MMEHLKETLLINTEEEKKVVVILYIPISISGILTTI
jgi:hypothetical protein